MIEDEDVICFSCGEYLSPWSDTKICIRCLDETAPAPGGSEVAGRGDVGRDNPAATPGPAQLSLTEEDGWRPIESAPRNGAVIWCFQAGVQYAACWFARHRAWVVRGIGVWARHADGELAIASPTHWRHQPSGPAIVAQLEPEVTTEHLVTTSFHDVECRRSRNCKWPYCRCAPGANQKRAT